MNTRKSATVGRSDHASDNTTRSQSDVSGVGEASLDDVRVSITMTPRDQENTATVKRATHARTNNQAVSSGLALSAAIVKLMQEGGELLVRKNGKVERLIFPGL